MLYLENPAETFTAWIGQPIDGIVHPIGIAAAWSSGELAAIGLYEPETPDIPDGQRVVSYTVERVEGVVTKVYVLEDVPPPEPYLNGGGLARFAGVAPIVVYESIRMAGVTRISKGRYRVLHEDAMPSDQYSVFPSVFDALPRNIRVTARTAAYVEVRVTDNAGAVQDPTEVSVKTERVVQ